MQAAGSLDALVADPSLAGTPKLQKLIETYGAAAKTYRDVSIVRRDLPLDLDWDTASYTPPVDGELYRLYSELEFKTLLAKLQPPVNDLPLFDTEKKLEGNLPFLRRVGRSAGTSKLGEELRALATAEHIAIALRGDALGISGKSGTGITFTRAALRHDRTCVTALKAALRSAIARRCVRREARCAMHCAKRR